VGKYRFTGKCEWYVHINYPSKLTFNFANKNNITAVDAAEISATTSVNKATILQHTTTVHNFTASTHQINHFQQHSIKYQIKSNYNFHCYQ